MTEPADTPAQTPATRSPFDLRHPDTAVCLLMLAVVLMTSDDARRLPLWPEAWGLAPPLNSVLVLSALVLMLHRICVYAGEAASNGRQTR